MKGKLVLEDGSVFEGSLLGGAPTVGEVERPSEIRFQTAF